MSIFTPLPIEDQPQTVDAREQASAAMYAALQAGDRQSYQAAALQFMAAAGGALPIGLQANPWNPAGAAPPSDGVVQTPGGQRYSGGTPIDGTVYTATVPQLGGASAVVRASQPPPVPPAPLQPATGRGELMTVERWKPLFLAAPVAGAAAGPVGLVVGLAFSFLGGLFGGLFGGGQDANKAIKQLRDEFVNVTNAVIEGYAQLARTVGHILKWIGAIILDFLKTLVDLLKNLIGMLKDLYNKVLKPALDAIQKIRKRILDIYEKYMRPVLLIIQKLHQILTVLKLFHLKFAAKLDAELMRIQRMITEPMYQLLGYINQIANMLNLVFDAGMVLRRAVTLNALDNTKGAWSQMWWNAQTDPTWQAPVPPAPVPSVAESGALAWADFREYAQSGGGPVAGQAEQNAAALRQYAQG